MKSVVAVGSAIAGSLLIFCLCMGVLGSEAKAEITTNTPALDWKPAPSLYAQVAYPSAQVAMIDGEEYVYVIGGATNSEPISSVYYAKIEPVNGIQEWFTTTAINTTGIAMHSTAVVRNQIFVIGGVKGRIGSSASITTVYCTSPLPNGSIMKWIETTPISQPLMYHTVVSIRDRIYIIGGWNTQAPVLKDRPQSSVYSGKVNDNCGKIEWRQEMTLPLPLARMGATVVTRNGEATIYAVGGWYFTATSSVDFFSTTVNTVYSASVDAVGRISKWYTATFLPVTPGLRSHVAVASDNALYVIGGTKGGSNVSSSIYRSPIDDSSGNLGKFVEITRSLPFSVYLHSSVIAKSGQIYLIGGQTWQNSTLTDTNTVIFTPLGLFSKSTDPPGQVQSGDYITYTLLYTNNGLKPLDDLLVIDKIPPNTRIVRPAYPSDTQVIAWTIPALLITGSGSVSFTVQVQPRLTAAQSTAPQANGNIDKSILDAPHAVVIPALAAAPARAETSAPGETPASPASAIPTPSDAPTPQSPPVGAGPNCPPTRTPTPVQSPTYTPTLTPTGTLTYTLTPTPTITFTPTPTPTVIFTPTPVPGPALVTNFAWLCGGNFNWCLTSNTTVNATNRVYLPRILKETTP
jgi:uncharacterized repeat protein (TIGR01451 family)